MTIVRPTHTIVQPLAVMVEFVHTTIALPAVLGGVTDIGLTDLTIVLVVLAVKDLSKYNHVKYLTPLIPQCVKV